MLLLPERQRRVTHVVGRLLQKDKWRAWHVHCSIKRCLNAPRSDSRSTVLARATENFFAPQVVKMFRYLFILIKTRKEKNISQFPIHDRSQPIQGLLNFRTCANVVAKHSARPVILRSRMHAWTMAIRARRRRNSEAIRSTRWKQDAVNRVVRLLLWQHGRKSDEIGFLIRPHLPRRKWAPRTRVWHVCVTREWRVSIT